VLLLFSSASALEKQTPVRTPCPAIFVLVSEGRSGSSAITDTVAKLTQSTGAKLTTELFGEDTHQMAALKDPLSMMVKWLEAKCGRTTGLRGFKFKPYFRLDASGQFEDKKWAAVMGWLHYHGASVLYSYRNPLDRIISGKTDEALDKLGIHQAHCQPLDKACIKAHQDVRVTLPTAEELKKALAGEVTHRSRLMAMFRRHHIRYKYVTFERLFSAPESEQLASWRDVIQFLQPQRSSSFSMSALKQARSGTIRVGAPHQKDRVKNYGEVVATLNGTAFQPLLH
jgi:hypothetical protein